METYTEKLNDNQIQLLKKKYYNYISDKKIPYALFQIKLEDCTITVYTSKKAVYQGEKASLYLTQPLEEDEAGSDEVGTGDYFDQRYIFQVRILLSFEDEDRPDCVI